MKAFLARAKSNTVIKWLLIVTIIFIILLIFTLISNAMINNIYRDTFLKGISLGGVDVSGLSLEQAKEKIEKRIDFINRRGFVYNTNLKTVVIYPTVAAIESADTSYPLVVWDVNQSLEQIKTWQNSNNLTNFFTKLGVLIAGREVPLNYYWYKEQHKEILEANLVDVLSTKQEASFSFVDDQLAITPEQIGQTFDYKQALNITEQQIKNLFSEDIKLDIVEDQPNITAQVIKSTEAEILNIAQRGDLYLTFNELDWNVANDIWRNWLTIKTDLQGYRVGFDQDLVEAYLVEAGIKDEVAIPMQDAKFQLSNGRVTEFINSQEGREIDWGKTMGLLDLVINNSGELEIAIAVNTAEPKVYNQDVNDLGIVELLGTGESDFRGSPVNRVHNIGIGADTLNGVLIKPGEEFSLLAALGEIDGEHGYRQELVIKGDQTIPEYGGGLCQIGTTVFRGAIASGMPITARRNHSYRVFYYEPAGTDATIYNPWPDFKFVNDTDYHILIQTRIEGTKLYFDYWGTSDERIVQITEPVIYNIVAPPVKKIIKTLELAPGQVKCTESAHNGADAKFDYSVQYPDEEEPLETTFYSHYIPWQEVCLLGVTEEEYKEYQAEQASSTEDGL